jgi:hypothetical protein
VVKIKTINLRKKERKKGENGNKNKMDRKKKKTMGYFEGIARRQRCKPSCHMER